jgi:hypothetical protein
MPLPNRQRAGMAAFVLGALLLAGILGPWSRAFLPTTHVSAVASVAEFYALCRDREVRGRRAVVLSRRLIPAEDPRGDSPETQRLVDLMHHGIVREIFHVVPDEAWPLVELNLSMVSIYRPSATGQVAAFEDGRVNVDPLSRFWPATEPVLLLMDPRSWDAAEDQAIARLVRSGLLRTDLVALLGGTPADVRRWAALTAQRGR